MRFRSRKGEVFGALDGNRKKALEAVGLEVSGAAKEKTPVDTGRLRASIAWAADGENRQHSETFSGGGGMLTVAYIVGAPRGTALVGTNVEYAVKVHEDLEGRVPRPGGVGQSKFIEAAARDKKARALSLIRRGLRGEL